jgi:hypothetical protein
VEKANEERFEFEEGQLIIMFHVQKHFSEVEIS